MHPRTIVTSGLLLLAAGAACSETSTDAAAPSVGLAPGAPWPKFRGDAAQTGKSSIRPSITDARPWEVRTGKGIFSSPVIGADGTAYIGSADRKFYAIGRDGQVKWTVLTGEIIDSSALLDDRGRVYFGSGDGKLRALDAATGREIWSLQADDPAENKAFIRWFEGNVAIGPSGALYVPNDNFFLYAVERDTGAVRWRFKMPDQTWSLPAVDARTDSLFVGNNNVLPLLGQNTFAIDGKGQLAWGSSSLGSIAASPMIAGDRVIAGGFDGFVRAMSKTTGDQLWEVPTRDHVYASPALLPDGTIVQPSTDGTVYALDPETGAVRWTFDTPDPIRSSPAVDADGNVYFGGGDGRLWVLGPDGKLRWSMLLVDEERNDLNSSPALGRDGIVIGAESGQVFGVPYDWCLRPEAAADTRCTTAMPPRAASFAELRFVTAMGSVLDAPPDVFDANEPITLQLAVREGGRAKLATLDASSVRVEATPATDVSIDVAGDGKFVTIAPRTTFADGTELRVTAQTLVDHARSGLKLSGGVPGGEVTTTVHVHTRPRGAASLKGPDANGAGGTTWELRRLALPLPTLMPSYNQIGFDSLHYFIGMVERGDGHGVAWMMGAKLADGEDRTVVDPTTRALFPLDVREDGDLVTFSSSEMLRVEVMNAVIPFQSFRIAARLDPSAGGGAAGIAKLNGGTICGSVPFYGMFLQTLGLCNPQTDALVVIGGANLVAAPSPGAGEAESAPVLGDVTVTRDADAVRATLVGSHVRAAEHVVAILLVDAATGHAVTLDYGVDTERAVDAEGNVTAVTVPLKGRTLPATVRAHLLVDTRPIVTRTLP